MCAFGFEGGAALLIDQPRREISKTSGRIAMRGNALGLEEQGPALAETLQSIVEARRHGDQLRLGGAVEVGTAVAQGALKTAVLVEHDAGRDQARPGEIVRQVSVAAAILGEVQHDRAPLWRACRDSTVRK